MPDNSEPPTTSGDPIVGTGTHVPIPTHRHKSMNIIKNKMLKAGSSVVTGEGRAKGIVNELEIILVYTSIFSQARNT